MDSDFGKCWALGLGDTDDPKSKIGVATSGGVDSQVLLHLAAKCHEGPLVAFAIDHGLRPEAASELKKAQDLAQTLGADFRQTHIEGLEQMPGNLMDNARKARYQRLAAMATEAGVGVVALGHHADDQAETLLMNLGRGCAGAGLRGMANGFVVDGVRFIRPLLPLSRQMLLDYAEAHGLQWAEDPSNRRGTRGDFRRTILPVVDSHFPQASVRIARFASMHAQDMDFIESATDPLWRFALGPMASLKQQAITKAHPALVRRVLRRWLTHHQIRPNSAHVALLYDILREREAPVTSLDRRAIRLEQGLLLIETATELGGQVADTQSCGLAKTPTWQKHLDHLGMEIHHEISTGNAYEAAVEPKEWREGIAFDADRLHFAPVWRLWRQGDRIRPTGMGGSKLVSDVFGENRMPRLLRQHWPLLVAHPESPKSVAGPQEVLWIPGLRQSRQAPTGPQTTRYFRFMVRGEVFSTLENQNICC